MTTIGVIGLGAMGSRIAFRLMGAGHEVAVWNRSPGKAAPLVEHGAIRASSPAELAGISDVVLTMLADPGALTQVTEAPDGIAGGATSGTTIIEMSTVGPDAIGRLAAALPEGVGLLDAPVLGSTTEVESGSLRIFVGGPADLVGRHTDLLSALGTPIHIGPLGSGAAAKLVANSTLFGSLSVFAEALALADALDLPRDKAYEVLSGTPVGAQVERRRSSIENDDYPLRFALTLALKDAELIDRAASDSGVDLRVADAARRWVEDAVAAGWGERDYSTLIGWILDQSRTASVE